VGHVVCKGKKRVAYMVMMEKPKGKRSLGRPRHRWEDNFKMNFKEIVWEAVNWIDVVQIIHKWQAMVDMAMNIWVI
jgi:hypothetical protein